MLNLFSNKKDRKYLILKEIHDEIELNMNKDIASPYYDSLLEKIEKNMPLFTAPKSALAGLGEYFFHSSSPDINFLNKRTAFYSDA